jgi:hypothetical protein
LILRLFISSLKSSYFNYNNSGYCYLSVWSFLGSIYDAWDNMVTLDMNLYFKNSPSVKKGEPQWFVLKNQNQEFYIKIDQSNRTALDLKNGELWWLNDYDQYILRSIEFTIRNSLRGYKSWLSMFKEYLQDKPVEEDLLPIFYEIKNKYSWYCTFSIKNWFLVIEKLDNSEIWFLQADKSRSWWLLSNGPVSIVAYKNEKEYFKKTLEYLKKMLDIN